jgi:glycosyltransferase involved in cell wall biosynthesis/predicted O-methyltransferase YrrM
MNSFSIIVTTRNNQKVIDKTLQSVAAALAFLDRDGQFKDVKREVIVVDDGSTDNTFTAISDFAQDRSIFKVIRRSASSSPSCARNTGAGQAMGDLLFFLDGDDLFFENHIRECCLILQDNAIDYVKTLVRLADPVHPAWKPRIENSLVINLCLRRQCHMLLNGFPDYHLFRRTHDGFVYDLDIFFKLEDMFYNSLLEQLFKGVKLKKETVEYCRHPGNAYDRQYEKFQRPVGEFQESPDEDHRLRFALGQAIIKHQVASHKSHGVPAAFTTDWFSHNSALFAKLLAPLKDQANVHFLEIGSFEGRSACWFLQNILTHPTSTLCCVDTFEGSAEHAGLDLSKLYDRFQENIRPFASRVRVFREPSIKALSRLQQEPVRFDVIYVDGSHMAVDVLTDAALSFSLLKVNGLLIFDDYGFPLGKTEWEKPKVAIDAFLKVFGQKCELVHQGYQLVVRKTSS